MRYPVPVWSVLSTHLAPRRCPQLAGFFMPSPGGAMPVRVKYRRTELSEGEHETFTAAHHYEVSADNTVLLYEHWTDEETGKAKKRQVGVIHPERWESVLVVEPAEA